MSGQVAEHRQAVHRTQRLVTDEPVPVCQPGQRPPAALADCAPALSSTSTSRASIRANASRTAARGETSASLASVAGTSAAASSGLWRSSWRTSAQLLVELHRPGSQPPDPARTHAALLGLFGEQAAERMQLGEHYGIGGLGTVFCTAAGRPISRQLMNTHFKRLTVAAGLGRDWQPRETRHTAVSLLSDAGQPIEDVSALVPAQELRSPAASTGTSSALPRRPARLPLWTLSTSQPARRCHDRHRRLPS